MIAILKSKPSAPALKDCNGQVAKSNVLLSMLNELAAENDSREQKLTVTVKNAPVTHSLPRPFSWD